MNLEVVLTPTICINIVFVKIPSLATVRKMCTSCHLIHISELAIAGHHEHANLHVEGVLNSF